jgi:hypothetical protein
MKRELFAAALTAALAGGVPASAKPPPRYGFLVYSDLCWEKESGDAAGHRITVRRTGDSDDLIFEYGEDGPLDAKLTSGKIDLKSGRIAFTVTMEGEREGQTEEAPFVGVITDEQISGVWTWLGEKRRMVLPRVRDVSRKIRECR